MALIVDGFEVDVEVSAVPTFASEVTEHPVEEGADIADHVRGRPVTLEIEGVVSNTPIGDVASRRGIDPTGATIVFPAEEARAKFISLRNAREPVTVECSHGVFENMVLSAFTPRSTTADELRFGLTFTQVELVTNERTTIRIAVDRAKRRNLGNRPAQSIEAGAPPPSAATSAAASNSGILNFLGL